MTKILFWVFILGFFLIYSVIFLDVGLFLNLDNSGMGKLGAFGDFMGGILNPILMFFTLFALILTILIQQKEFSLQRKEFIGQKEALIHQKNEMIKQTFDNKFFQMLNSFNDLIRHLSLSKNKYEYEGKEVIELISDNLIKTLNKKSIYEYITLREFAITLNNFDKDEKSYLEYYSMNLYQILKFIDNESPDTVIAKDYTNLLRAQLSNRELRILFFKILELSLIHKKCKFKILVEKYNFFEYLDFNNLVLNMDIKAYETLFITYAQDLNLSIFGENIQLKNKFVELKNKSNELSY